MAWSDAARAAAAMARRRKGRKTPTVGENQAQMEHLVKSSSKLRARISAATVAAMQERERIAPSSELYGRPKSKALAAANQRGARDAQRARVRNSVEAKRIAEHYRKMGKGG